LIISLAAASKTEFIRKSLENRILVVFGGASYALYLLQFPMRKYITLLVPDHLVFYARIAFTPTLICVSVLVFTHFEGPMRKLLRRALEPAKKKPENYGLEPIHPQAPPLPHGLSEFQRDGGDHGANL